MEWLADPTIWIGLFTLILIEVVLGIDNLVFIAILVDKLPPEQRDRARIIGLGLALVMRLGLLAAISWLVTLTAPLITLFDHSFSGRDLIMLFGGLFLLFKATSELHERLEGRAQESNGVKVHAAFGVVVTQIIVLDAVFSIDSVITAVGMVEHLPVMMAAVIVAVCVMIIASKPLTAFVNRHQTVVMLCLGFLLMIGFSLVAEGLGFHMPKGYLYAAIGFSILVEVLNQAARISRERQDRRIPLRQRTTDAVIRMLGGDADSALVPASAAGADGSVLDDAQLDGFSNNEREMVRSVIRLGDRPVDAIMTPRRDIVWLDLNDSPEELIEAIARSPHTRLPVARGDIDQLAGIVHSRDLLARQLAGEPIDIMRSLREPLIVYEGTSALKVLDQLRQHPVPMAVVADEYGGVEGLVTTTDLLAEIAGDLPDTVEPDLRPQQETEGVWLLDGRMPIEDFVRTLELPPMPETDFHTLAGLILARLGRLPVAGDRLEIQGYELTVDSLDGQRIAKIRVQRLSSEPESV